jgi:hypothetical protein
VSQSAASWTGLTIPPTPPHPLRSASPAHRVPSLATAGDHLDETGTLLRAPAKPPAC